MIVLANGRQKIYVSDLIGEEYKKWSNEFVVLDCGTGCGKTYFCVNVLGEYAQCRQKTILYLCNRKKLWEDILHNVKRKKLSGTIWVETYQSLQKKILNRRDIPDYDYIIADECHYFTTDAKFNGYTDVSYDYLMKQKQSVVLWVSATAKIFFRWLKDKNKVKKRNIYCIDKDYSYVKRLYFYQKDELITIIDDILQNNQDDKIVVFCNSADRIYEMHRVYGDNADYFCSSSSRNQKLKKICGYDESTKTIKSCLVKDSNGNNTFEKRILFTTTVLDNGIDLKDVKIKHVFSEIFDIDSMIQSLGRKRTLDENDTCTFYVKEYADKAIQGLLNINVGQLNPVFVYKNDYDNFFKEYGSGKKRQQISKNKIFYSYFAEDKRLSKIKVNECRYRKYEQDNHILLQMKKWGYKTVVLSFLGKQLSEKSENIVVDVKKIDIFLEYLKSIEGKYLFAEDKQRVKDEFEEIGVKLRYTGINTFNGALEDIYKDLYPCRFYNQDVNGKVFIDKRRKISDGIPNPNRDKKYWILENRLKT